MRNLFNRGPMILVLAVFLLMTSTAGPISGLQENSGESSGIFWIHQFGSGGDDGATSVAVDKSGNSYVAGNVRGPLSGQNYLGLDDAFIRKYDGDGAELWTRQFGGPNNDIVQDIAVDGSGNIYATGQTNYNPSSSLSQSFISKYDSDGTEKWTRYLAAGDFTAANSIAVDGYGNSYIAGGTTGTFTGQSSGGSGDAFVRKYDGSGTELWTRQFGTSGDEVAFSIAVDSTGNIYVAGVTDGALSILGQSSGNDAFLRKYDSSGNEQWTRQFGNTGSDAARGLCLDPGGNIYVAGYVAIPNTNPYLPEDTNAFVRLYDQDGIEQWTIKFGTEAWDAASAIIGDDSGNFYVAGLTDGTFPGQTSTGGSDSFITMYDRTGLARWTRQFGSLYNHIAVDLAGDSKGNLWAVGTVDDLLSESSSGADHDAYVTKFSGKR